MRCFCQEHFITTQPTCSVRFHAKFDCLVRVFLCGRCAEEQPTLFGSQRNNQRNAADHVLIVCCATGVVYGALEMGARLGQGWALVVAGMGNRCFSCVRLCCVRLTKHNGNLGKNTLVCLVILQQQDPRAVPTPYRVRGGGGAKLIQNRETKRN